MHNMHMMQKKKKRLKYSKCFQRLISAHIYESKSMIIIY